MSVNLNKINLNNLTEIDINSANIDIMIEEGLYLCEYNGYSSYLMITDIYDPFFKESIVNQIIFTLEDNKTYNVIQYKSRKHIPNLLNDHLLWSKWSTSDSDIFNYINEFIKSNYDRFAAISNDTEIKTEYTVSDFDQLTDANGNTLTSILNTITEGTGITTIRFWE